MKEIKDIIQPHMLTKVVEVLKQIENIPGITVDKEVRGYGGTYSENTSSKVVDDMVEYVHKAKIEVVVPNSMLELVVSTI